MTTPVGKAGGPQAGRPNVKPRPVLFAVLCVVFALWIALLVFLYVTTVYPVRHP